MNVHIVEGVASGAPFVAPILVLKLDALRGTDDTHLLSALGVSVKVAIRAGAHVGDPPDGAHIEVQALAGEGAFPVFAGTLRVEPVDAFSCRLVLAGEYSVPLGTLGTLADRTILAGIAKRSMRAFLVDMQAEIASSVLQSLTAFTV
jgi:hypothetical protein